MTGLLVSVRDADEARLALAAGVDVIDIKEPARGSLGAASMATVRSVVDVVAGRTTVSAACGELLDFVARDAASNTISSPLLERRQLHGPNLANTNLAKIGLAGCDERGDWQQCWRRWTRTLPKGVRPVAVAYADRHLAHSPSWESIVALAAAAGSPYVLVDTFDKQAGTLFDHWTTDILAAFAELTRDSGIGFVLAGSLRLVDIARAREFHPDFVAVRGAACRGGRSGTLDLAAIEQLVAALGRQPIPTQ